MLRRRSVSWRCGVPLPESRCKPSPLCTSHLFAVSLSLSFPLALYVQRLAALHYGFYFSHFSPLLSLSWCGDKKWWGKSKSWRKVAVDGFLDRSTPSAKTICITLDLNINMSMCTYCLQLSTRQRQPFVTGAGDNGTKSWQFHDPFYSGNKVKWEEKAKLS